VILEKINELYVKGILDKTIKMNIKRIIFFLFVLNIIYLESCTVSKVLIKEHERINTFDLSAFSNFEIINRGYLIVSYQSNGMLINLNVKKESNINEQVNSSLKLKQIESTEIKDSIVNAVNIFLDLKLFYANGKSNNFQNGLIKLYFKPQDMVIKFPEKWNDEQIICYLKKVKYVKKENYYYCRSKEKLKL
jgi:hypothetical protein